MGFMKQGMKFEKRKYSVEVTVPFLRLNNIPLYVYATFCFSIYLSWAASTFFTVVNNTAVSIDAQISDSAKTVTV